MTVKELMSRLEDMNPEARVMFDTEAQRFDVHLVSIDFVHYHDFDEPSDPVVTLHEDHPHRMD